MKTSGEKGRKALEIYKAFDKFCCNRVTLNTRKS